MFRKRHRVQMRCGKLFDRVLQIADSPIGRCRDRYTFVGEIICFAEGGVDRFPKTYGWLIGREGMCVLQSSEEMSGFIRDEFGSRQTSEQAIPHMLACLSTVSRVGVRNREKRLFNALTLYR
jgi:hypothetical protein